MKTSPKAAQMRRTLEAARHEFAFLTGLRAFDAADTSKTWRLSYRTLIARIDRVLSRPSASGTGS
jgi:hypothetical protein